jgi:O-antigen/teichoic acid export membrane protein
MLEAYQRFDLVNIVLVPVKIGVLVLSIVGALLNFKLYGIVILLIAMRVLMAFVLFLFDVKICPEVRRVLNLDFKILPTLLSFGGWVTVINIVNPFLVYIDRFLIGAILSVSVLAYYTAPFEILQRLWIIPVSLNMTLFPAFSSLSGDDQSEKLGLIFSKAVKLVFVVLFPIVFVLSFFSFEILEIWLGFDFAVKSSDVFKVIALGIFASSIAGFPTILLQGIGRPELPAKLYLVELVFYIPFVSFSIYKFGIIGAGVGWLIRQVIEMVLLYWMVFKTGTVTVKNFFSSDVLNLIFLSIVLVLFLFVGDGFSLWLKIFIAIFSIALFSFIVWFKILNHREREEIKLLVRLK